jgi:hypothetical protein
MDRNKMMKSNKMYHASLFLFSIVFISVSVANKVFASRTESVMTCLGTYTYAYDVVRKDELIDMWVFRDDETGNVTDVMANIHVIPSYQAQQYSISESNTELLAMETDLFNTKTVIRYNKANKHLLFVVNDSNGNKNKFEGTCF